MATGGAPGPLEVIPVGTASQPAAGASLDAAAHPASGGVPVDASVPPPHVLPVDVPAQHVAGLDPTAPLAAPDPTLQLLTTLGSDSRVLISAAVATMAGAAIIAPRAAGAGADWRLAFTNVRLLPCLAMASVQQNIALLTDAVAPRASGGGGMGFATAGDAARADSGSNRISRATSDAVGAIEEAGKALREGFAQTIENGGSDGLSDSRLFVQIGMALGFVYLAFLTVWFWATRVLRRPEA